MSCTISGSGVLIQDGREHQCAEGKTWLQLCVEFGRVSLSGGKVFIRRVYVWSMRAKHLDRMAEFKRGVRVTFRGRAGGLTMTTATGKHYSYPLAVIGERDVDSALSIEGVEA